MCLRVGLCGVMIDGISFDGGTFVVALDIGQDGRKTVLGLRQGTTENATVVGELCADLEHRGVDFQKPRLYVLDGAQGTERGGEEAGGRGGVAAKVSMAQAGGTC